MRLRLYTTISVFIFFILYCFTEIGVLIVLIFAALKMRKPVNRLCQLWAKSVFLITGKKFKITGLEYIRKVAPFHLDGERYFSYNFDVGLNSAGPMIIYNPHGPHFFRT